MPWTRADAAAIREMIERKANATNHHLTWVVTLQGLLFAALSFAWRDGKDLIPILGGLGVLSSLSSLIVLRVAHLATGRLLAEWEWHRPNDYEGPAVIGYFVSNRLLALALPWFLLPLIFSLAWTAVLWVHSAQRS